MTPAERMNGTHRLKAADDSFLGYAACVSGNQTDKTEIFACFTVEAEAAVPLLQTLMTEQAAGTFKPALQNRRRP